MKPIHAHDARFEAVTILGIPGLFSPLAIDRATIPPGMYAYDLQCSETDWSQPVCLAPLVTHGYYGSILTASPIDFSTDGKVTLSPGDFVSCVPFESLTVAEFESLFLSPVPYRSW